MAHRCAPGPLLFTGVGVEDPAFQGEMQHAHADELSRWTEILGAAAHLTVRGPLSARLLRDVGIEAPHVSDPALLLGPVDATGTAVRPKLLGLNIADPEDQYRGTGTRVFDACAAAVRTLLRSQWSVRLFPFTRKDLILARAFRQALDGRVEIFPGFHDVDELLGSIAECDVLVGQRLHAVVLAAAVAVPALAVDYRPKCRDFQLSIGRGDWTVSTLDVSAALVVDRVTRLHEARSEHVRHIQDAVANARATLRDGERAVVHALASR
jgi:polysaccharide pyruvyl transferase WcaK-like protein